MSTHETDEPGQEDHGSNFKFFVIFVALCILTAMSFFTYSSYWPQALDNDAIKRTFMMAVSFTKAMLVILFFMHLLWEANWKYALTIPASFMSLFLLLMLVPDVGLRMNHVSRERRLHMAIPQAADHGVDHGTDHGSAHDGSDAAHTDHTDEPHKAGDDDADHHDEAENSATESSHSENSASEEGAE